MHSFEIPQSPCIAAFVNAFSEFIYLDSSASQDVALSEFNSSASAKGGKNASSSAKQGDGVALDESRRAALKEIIDKLIEEDGWALYARIATEMKNKYSDFVPKNYNCRSLKELIGKVLGSIGDYEIKTGSDGSTMFLIPKKAEQKSEKTPRKAQLKIPPTSKGMCRKPRRKPGAAVKNKINS